MKDFSSWEEIKEWIDDPDDMEVVCVESLYFSRTYMSCGEGCCDEPYDNVDYTMDAIKQYSGGDITKVSRV